MDPYDEYDLFHINDDINNNTKNEKNNNRNNHNASSSLSTTTTTTTKEILDLMRARYRFLKEWAQSGNPV